jgi:hypothetical protein
MTDSDSCIILSQSPALSVSGSDIDSDASIITLDHDAVDAADATEIVAKLLADTKA